MVVLEQDSEGMHLVEQRPRQPVAVAGMLFLALGLLPIVSEGSLTALRLLTAASLALGAALCFVLGLPRPRRLPLPDAATTRRLVLSGTSNIEGYTVDALASAGARRSVLSGSDPGRVLSDAISLSAALGVPLEPGWGLGREALGAFRAPGSVPSVVQPLVVSHRVLPDQAIGAGTALWAAAFIPLATVVLALSPARPSLTPTVLAFVLPALTALYALVVGLWLLGLRETLTFERGRVTRQKTWFKRPLGAPAEAPGIVGLHAVAPLGGPARHLLAVTRSGPIAFATEAKTSDALAQYSAAEASQAGRAAE